MDGGGGHAPAPSQPSSSANGGEFLLSLLQKRNQSQSSQPQNMTVDPAVAAVGPSIHSMPWSSSSNNGHHLSSHPLPPWSQSSPYRPPNFFLQGFPQNPWNPPGNNFPGNQFPGNNFQHALLSGDDVRRLGFQQQPPKPELMFGSLPFDIQKHEGLLNSNRTDNSTSGSDREGLLSKIEVQMKREFGLGNGSSTGLDRNRQFELQGSSNSHRIGNYDNREQDRRGNNDGWGRQLHGVVHRPSHETPRPPPPGFPSNPRGGRNSDSGNWRISSEHNVGVENGGFGEFNNNRVVPSINEVEILRRRSPDHNNSNGKARSGETLRQPRLTDQFDRPGPHSGINLHSTSASEIEESMMNLHAVVDENEHAEIDGSSDNKDEKKRHKDVRSDTRGNWLLSQKMRNLKRQMIIRRNIDTLHAPFLAIYETLIPAEEEKAKQKQLLALLEKLVCKEWPKAHLYLYGSCASSFGVSKSDIDVCFAIEDPEINKSDLLLRLADILKSDNLQNVQALTRARVPIVKLMDPVTGISCDICVNNVLAVVNTKLLRDYAQIDVRLRQLAFLVKHWAKSRGVNATYQGTLSSYAYVIMCIHFLQQRKPAVLPCLQRMEATFSATIDTVECAYFDRVDKLSDFGSHNKENIAQLVWGFFNYWAYCHDYANTVISVRTGSIISKQSKDWTKRIGNDRHLICIEDPFETSHDLGRVVDKYSIKVLREEFERAANIMQFDPNPCVKLFEPYVPEGRQSN